jgi:thiamine pyrophosphate-dependent acetolactate synthase large subunit-like protein
MREIVKEYLDHRISRRGFMTRMTGAGFGTVAAASALRSLEPAVQASSAQGSAPAAGGLISFRGTGGEILAEQLKAAGIKFLFLGNGSGLGPLCDALVDRPDMQVILGVHENHCVSMADGYAKASGQPGFVMFSRVGSPNASSNMYNAMKDRSPLIIASDHAEAEVIGRDGHEDVEDWLETVEQFTKFRWAVESTERIPEWTMKALKLATTMPGGPCHLRFSRPVLYQKDVEVGIFAPGTFTIPANMRPHPADVERGARMLLEAQSPLLYVGSEVYASGAVGALMELAELLAIPVTQARSWAADFPTAHPLHLGAYSDSMRHPATIDLFFTVGAHLPHPGSVDRDPLRSAKIIHARMETEYLGTAYPVHLPLVASVKETLTALVEAVKGLATTDRLKQIRESRLAATERFTRGRRLFLDEALRRQGDKVPLTWERVAFEINAVVDRDACVVEEFGTQGPKALQQFSFGPGEKTKIGRTTGYALGWGVGASVGVKLARPDQQVVCLQGDGGFLFGQAEALWSMSRYDAPVILVIFNNRCYNETRSRMFGEGGRQAQAGKDMLSDLGKPDVDFVRLGEAFGIQGAHVRTPAEVRTALTKAVETTRDGRPFLIDALVERSGAGAEVTWHPEYSVAAQRSRRV